MAQLTACPKRIRLLPAAALLLLLGLACRTSLVSSSVQQALKQNVAAEQANGNYPQYLQSPFAGLELAQSAPNEQLNRQVLLAEGQSAAEQQMSIEQRSLPKRPASQMLMQSGPRNINGELVPSLLDAAAKAAKEAPKCLYDKRYFAKLDQCLSRKPFPTVGLPAFKNEDLLIKRGLNEKHGCLFILNNGLFKGYQIPSFSVDSDSQCLDGSRTNLLMSFSNVTMSYLWTLRCLNRADQLFDDATLDGKTLEGSSSGGDKSAAGICVGSSQNFGFASLQLSGVEAQVELATDIYKNWRITNITVAMLAPTSQSASAARASQLANEHQQEPSAAAGAEQMPQMPGTNIKDYVFESLDGDELNWRYLHMFQNWSRNRMHTNFLEQYRRFLWISLQRCLGEASDRLPTKLVDVFEPK